MNDIDSKHLEESHETATGEKTSRSRSAFVVSFVSIAILLIGGWLTSLGLDDWYRGLNFPPFQPPGWVFTPVWTALFALLARSTWLVLQSGGGRTQVAFALGLYGSQCVLNLGWSLLFFALQRPDAALYEILALDATVAAMIFAYAKCSRTAAVLLLPYFVWISFATAINAWIVKFNGPF